MTNVLKIYNYNNFKMIPGGYIRETEIDLFKIKEINGEEDVGNGQFKYASYYVITSLSGYYLSPLFDTAQDAEGFLRDDILAPLGCNIIGGVKDEPPIEPPAGFMNLVEELERAGFMDSLEKL